MDISTTIGHTYFKTCLWNAAGPRCTTLEELDTLSQCDANGAIVTKTCTLDTREGNVFPRVVCEDGSMSINSVGLANKGIDAYLGWIEDYKRDPSSKPVFLSVGGLSMKENKELLRKIRYANVQPDFVELNVSCPNLEGCSIVGYDFDSLKQYMNLLTINIGLMRSKGIKISCGVKLPPYFDEKSFMEVSSLLNEFSDLDYITTINGVPNCLVVDTYTEDPVIKPKEGYGGVGGSITKPIGLANVSKFRKYLDSRIKIIGCGGICTGEDAFQYLLCGADAVETATQFLHEGESCFDRILKELQQIMREKEYENLKTFRGKLAKK